MSSSTEPRSPFLRFLNAFLQEENIKWILGAGVCILLGSSLRLVAMYWDECTPIWQYLILLGYTAAIFGLSEFSYHRMGLRKTGTVLMALTVLLIPVSFLALHWVRHTEDSSTSFILNSGLSALLGINLIWSSFAARRIFGHFLRANQPTFLVCYLILCLSGAIVPGLPAAWSLIMAIVLWMVFSIGTIKVNRHIFWLTEEYRLPRIFGFFPILLLGAQFAAVFWFGLANHISLGWIGTLCTLVALPILLTADTVARVFEQRTGGLIRPIPWSISGPLLLGTTCSVTGLILSLTGWPVCLAAAPTAAIAAVTMAIIANRTQKSAFVWGMIFCVTMAYQTSPAFFREFADQIRRDVAVAINEERLPYAFYGLTYAPLIVVFSGLANLLQRRGQVLFALPLKRAASVLPWLLLAVSFTDSKAILPVAMILCPLFVLQATLFQQRLLLIPASMSILAAAYGLPLFSVRVWDCPFSIDQSLLVWVSAAALLFVPGFLVDRWSRSLGGPSGNSALALGSQNICQLFSLVATLAASVCCVERFGSLRWQTEFGMIDMASILVGLLLVSHSLRWLKPRLTEWTLVFSTYAILTNLRLLHPDPASWDASVGILTILLSGQLLVSYVLPRWPHARVTRAFALPLIHVSSWGMSLLLGVYVCNWVTMHVGSGFLSWWPGIVVLAWGLDAARRLKWRAMAAIAWSSVFIVSTAAVTSWFGTNVAVPWWMSTWAATGVALLIARQFLTVIFGLNIATDSDLETDQAGSFREDLKVWLSPLTTIIPTVFLLIAVANLLFLDWPRRIAGAIALSGLCLAHRYRIWPSAAVLFWPLLNWKLLVTLATVFAKASQRLYEIAEIDLQSCALPMAALAGISLWLAEQKRPREWMRHLELIVGHQLLLVVLIGSVLFNSLRSLSIVGWTPAAVCWATIAWLFIAATLLANGLRSLNRENIWNAQLAMLLGIIYFLLAGVIEIASPVIPYGCLLVGILMWVIGVLARRSQRFEILSTPFETTGFWLPLAVVPFALCRQFGPFAPSWAGANSLPLLGAAAFYFWRGIERRQVGTTVMSAVILNVATSLVWTDLHWTDPQLFLVPVGICVIALTELLHREIPAEYHDKLRLAGALSILVSPTFHVVTGSWLHILTLLLAALFIALIAIGLRVRILLYTSNAFLIADLIALVVRGSMDEPNVLWIVGVAIGAAVITLGAICENHREILLSRLRGLAAELELWR